MHWFISVRTTREWLTGNAKKKEDTCWTWYETQTNKLCDNLFKPYHPPVPLKLPRKTLITLTPTPIPYDNKEKEREREKKIKTRGRWGDRWRDRWRRDRQKKEIFILMFHQKRASERLQRETKRLKRMRSADKMVRSQALWNADSGRRHFNLWLPFHIDSPTFVHLSQFRFNISFSKFRWLIPLCIWFSSISMILQHQDINLVPFIMLPGNRSELNLVRWKDINKNKKNKKPLFATTDAELVCVGLLVFSDWGISKTLNDIPVTRCCL